MINSDLDLELLRELSSDDGGPAPDARTAARVALLEATQRNPSHNSPRAPRVSRLRRPLDAIVLAGGVLIVVAVVAVFLSSRAGDPAESGAPGGTELVYEARPTPQAPAVTNAALARTVAAMRARAAGFGLRGVSITRSGVNEISVRLPPGADVAAAEAGLAASGRLEFYDWEANALMPSGKTVASRLRANDPQALVISDGAGGAPGASSAGGMSLYDAVRLAAKQPQAVGPGNARKGSQFYLFGNGGSPACAASARLDNVAAAPAGQHCLLAGPATSPTDLLARLPRGVTPSQGQRFEVKQGTVVLQATPTNFAHRASLSSPSARFFVLKDDAALFGNAITNPKQSTDAVGTPDVTFGFNRSGAHRFQQLTAAIAHRGLSLGGPASGNPMLQHLAVALDELLITVPAIDYRTYPDGISGSGGAQITGGFTRRSAQDLAVQLRGGGLPLALELISSSKAQPSTPRTR